MIVLDTNVISELMRPAPEPAVVAWLDRQPAASVWTASLCVFEIQLGLALLPAGKRRDGLTEQFERMLAEDLGGRVLDLNTASAYAAAGIAGANQPRGLAADLRDLLIAGTVAARRGTLATRNVKHFRDAGVDLINPWNAPTGP